MASTSALLVTTGLTSGSGFLYWAVAARSYSADDVGRGTALVAVLCIIGLLSGQGLAATLLSRLPRALPEQRKAMLVTALATACGLAVLLATGALAVLPHIAAEVTQTRTPAVAAAFVTGAVAQAAGVVLDAASIALQRGGITTARNAVFGLGKLGLLVLAALPWLAVGSLPALVGSWALMGVASACWAARRLMRAARDIGGGTGARVPSALTLRRGVLAQNVAALSGVLPQFVLPVVVAGRLGAGDAAFVGTAWMLAGLCSCVSPAVSAALVAAGSSQPDELRQRTRTAVLLTAGLLIVPVAGLLLAGPLVLQIFGPAYVDAGAPLLRLLAIAAVPSAVTDLAISVLRVRERLREAALLNAAMALVTVGLAWVLLPHLGVVAAGWGWAAAQTLGAGVIATVLLARRRGVRLPGAALRRHDGPPARTGRPTSRP